MVQGERFKPLPQKMAKQNRRNLITGLILAAIAIGIFLYTVMQAQPQ